MLRQLDSQVAVLEAATSEEAARISAHAPEFGLILLDIALPGLRELAPTAPVIVLSGPEILQQIKLTLEKGASGYISKSCSAHEMLNAVAIVLRGGLYAPPGSVPASISVQTLRAGP